MLADALEGGVATEAGHDQVEHRRGEIRPGASHPDRFVTIHSHDDVEACLHQGVVKDIADQLVVVGEQDGDAGRAWGGGPVRASLREGRGGLAEGNPNFPTPGAGAQDSTKARDELLFVVVAVLLNGVVLVGIRAAALGAQAKLRARRQAFAGRGLAHESEAEVDCHIAA